MRKSGLTGDEAYALSKRRGTSGDLGPLKKEIGLIKEDLSKINDYIEEPENRDRLTDKKSQLGNFDSVGNIISGGYLVFPMYIDVEPNTQYFVNNINYLGSVRSFDLNKTVLSSGHSVSGKVITTGDNTHYVRISVNGNANPAIVTFQKGTSASVVGRTTLNGIYPKDNSVEKSMLEEEVQQSLDIYSDYTVFTKEQLETFASNLPSSDLKIAMQTDTHYSVGNGYKNSINPIKSLVTLSRMTKFDAIANLGDLVEGNNALTTTKNDIARLVNLYSKSKCQYLQLVGNHDDNTWYSDRGTGSTGKKGIDEALIQTDWYGLVVSKIKGIAENYQERYFSYDISDKKVRVICLDTLDVDYTITDGTTKIKYNGQWVYAIRQRQIDWLISCLKLPSNWSVIILSHHCIADGEKYANEPIKNSDIVRGILGAFKNGTSYSGSSTITDFSVSVNVDFSLFGAKNIIGCFAGHNHADAMFNIDGINYIQIDDSKSESVGATDVACIDLSNKNVILKRLGTGSDRSFHY